MEDAFSVSRSNHVQYMGGILGKSRPVFFQLIGKLKEKLLTFVIPFEKRRKNIIPLGQIT